MVQIAQLVPQNVEKIPLWHWRPGSRLLVAGDRDGASFSGEPVIDDKSFVRDMTPALVREAQAQAGTNGLCAAWSASLHEQAGLHFAVEHATGARVVVSSGHGDPELLAQVIGAVDAWLLLIGEGGPLDELILMGGRHVEVLLGLDGKGQIPNRSWEHASAIHLAPRTPTAAVGDELTGWEQQAREQLPASAWIYGQGDRHTHCRNCDRVLVYRYGGRSRIEGLDRARRCCAECGAPAPIII